MKIKFSDTLFPWQSDCISLLESSPHSTVVIKSRRQTGKTLMSEIYLLKKALDEPQRKIFYLLPTYAQCLKVFKEISLKISNAPFTESINASQFLISFKNGSYIRFLSASMPISNLQGFTAHILLVDEAAFISDEVIQTCQPYLNTTDGQLVLVSTPQYKSGIFYDTWITESDNVEHFDFCDYDTSELLSETRLEYYRKTMPKQIFEAHFLGQFIDDFGQVFGDFSHNVRKIDEDLTQQNKSCICSIDWASGGSSDYTVLTFIYDDYVDKQIRFNDLDETAQIEKIKQEVEKRNVEYVIVETNGIGKILFGLLKKSIKNIPVKSFTTTNENKHLMVSTILVSMQNNAISLPNDNVLLNELSKYEMVLNQNGKPIYNAKSGSHDDCVMSLLIGWYAKHKGRVTTFL